MNGVRVYMRAGWNKNAFGTKSESSDVTILEYKDAHYEYSDWLRVYRDKDEIATFPPGDWVGVERF